MSVERPDEQQARRTRFGQALEQSTRRLLNELASEHDVPDRLDFFVETLRKTFVPSASEGKAQLYPNRKVIGTYCVMTPEELIYAAGAVPVRLCGGSYEAAAAGDELVPRDICPVVRSAVGFSAFDLLPIYRRCDAVVVPTTCDSKRKLGEALSEYTKVWMLEVPHLKEAERSRLEWLEQVYAIKNNLEKLTGRKIGAKELKSAAGRIAKAQNQARRLHALRKSIPPLILGKHAMLALNAYAFAEVDEWTAGLTALNDELEARQAAGKRVANPEAPRLLLAGSPAIFPNWKLPLLIEEMGGVIAADESCVADRYLYDPVGAIEGNVTEMVRALAARLIMPCTCPSFSPNEDRLYRLRYLVKEFKITGVIYHVLKGCLIYDFEVVRVERLMKELGVPVLRVETDYNPEDVEQLRTRIEAFVEMTRSAART